MVSPSSVGLLVLFCFGVCSGQRKISRNVPVGADVKTTVNFDCPEEFGYYPHPSDCTQYYVCVFGGALLESCTGGLMYSHELQTCDWPRNVGCDGLEVSGPPPASTSTSSSGRGRDRERERERDEPRTRYSPPPPPPQPAAVVTSRGQPRQLHHTQQEIIKQQQQQQLYAEAEETLPPAEEIENDRQQRVYRGQPSTVGQVQRDRDGLRHSNAIPSYSGRGDKIGVISFGTQNQHYSGVTDIDDLLTNDLTLKRRRKRQVHRSRPREEANSWHGARRSNRNTFTRVNTSPLLPPPIHNQNSNFKPSHLQTESSEEFRPFIPDYKINYPIQVPSNEYSSKDYQQNVRQPISAATNNKNNYAYFTLDKTDSQIKTPDQLRKIIDFHYNDDNPTLVLEPAYTNVLPQKQSRNKFKTLNETRKSESSKQITEAVTSGYDQYVSSNPERIRSDENVEERNKEDTSDGKAQEAHEEEDEEEHFNPPPEFFRTESRYENIRNPFADPEFDFDRFLDRLRGTTTPRPKVKVINKSVQGASKLNANSKVNKTASPVLAANLRTPVPFKNSFTTTELSSSPGEYRDTSNAKTVLKNSAFTKTPSKSASIANEYHDKTTVRPLLFLKEERSEFDKTTVKSRPFGSEYFETSTVKPLHILNHEANDFYKSIDKSQPTVNQYYERGTAKPTLFLEQDTSSFDKSLPSRTRLKEYYEKSTVKPVSFVNSGISHFDKTTVKPRPKVHEYYEDTTANPKLVNNEGSDSYNPRLIVNEYYEKVTEKSTPVTNYKISDFGKTAVKSRPTVNEYYEKDTTRSTPVTNYKISDFDKTAIKSRPSVSEYYEKSTVKPINREPIDSYKAAVISRPVTNDYYERSTIKPFLIVNRERSEFNQTTVKSVPTVNQYYKQSTAKPSVNHETSDFYRTPAKSRLTTTDYYEKSTIKPIVKVDDETRGSERTTIKSKSTVNQYHQQKTEKPVVVRHEASDSFKTSVKSRPVVSEYFEKSTVKPVRFVNAITTVRTSSSSTVNPLLANDRLQKTTVKSKVISREKHYGDHEDITQAPKKIYSSQIKSSLSRENKTAPKKHTSDYEYYYDEDEDNNSSNNNKKKDKSTNKNYYYDDDNYDQQKITRNGSKSSEVKYSAKYQEKPQTEKSKTNRASSTTTPSPPTAIKKTSDSHSSQSKYTSTTPNPVHNTRQRKRPTARQHTTTTTTTMKPTRGKSKQRLTTQRYDLDTKREQSKVYISEESSVAPAQASIATATATARTHYNNSQYNNHYDPYYALYDDDVELYRDVDYSQHNNYNSAQRTPTSSYRGTPAPAVQSTSSREESPKRGNSVYLQNNYNPQDIYQQSTGSDYADDNRYDAQVDDQTPYRQSSRQPSRGDRNELNDVEEAITKRTTTTTTTRKPTTTTTRTTTTTTTTPRTIPPKKSTAPPPSRTPVTAKENQTQAQSIINTIPEDPGHTPDVSATLPLVQNPSNNSGIRHDITTNLPVTYRPKYPDTNPDYTLHESSFHEAVIKKPAPFSLPTQITTEKPAFHYITKPPKSTDHISSTVSLDGIDENISNSESSNPINQHKTTTPHRSRSIVPTTYSPPKFFLKSILPKPISHTTPVFSFRSANRSDARTYSSGDNVINPDNFQSKSYKTLKAVRKLINPITVNHELSTSTGATYESAEKLVSSINFDDLPPNAELLDYRTSIPVKSTYIEPKTEDTRISPTTIRFSGRPTTTATKATTTKSTSTAKYTTSKATKFNIISTSTTPKKPYINEDYIRDRLQSRFENEKLRNYLEPDQNNFTVPVKKRFRTTVEIPPAHEFLDSYDKQKPEPDQLPAYKPKPFPKPILPAATTTDIPQNTSFPTRVSRVNAAIKSLIANGGTRRPNSKCNENQSPNSKCNNDAKQRTSSRGRGSAHYASTGAQITNNEVTVNTNRGTPAPRSRPTLKPSTSIVSKAQEFIDIYKFPPRRPDPIYPQPQPDKTAAKCRKDVCLLPDCSCGGKEIPGNISVEETPQMVLITFDDAVNDLNKQYYIELFENGRKNPNGCAITATFYVSHEWTDYSQVQNLYADGHEMASHTVSHSFGEQFSQKKWTREVAGQREILSAYGGVHLEDVRGMRAPFLSVGGNKMFKMLYDSNFTYDSSMPIYENKPPSWPYTLDYKLFHDCMIPPCPTRSYPGVWEVPMVMWQDLNGGRCSMGDACSNPPDADGVFKMLTKNFQRHYTTNRAPFGLFYHAAWFTQPHHKEGFINFIDSILAMKDVWLVTNWQAIQWVRDPTPTSRLNSFQPFQCDFSDRPKRCNNPKVCNLWHKSGVRYMRTCQPCPETYPWTGNTGIRSSRIDNDIED